MAKLLCPCGYQMSNVGSPNDYEHWLLSDNTLDRMSDFVDLQVTDIMDYGEKIWKCPECGWLSVMWKNQVTMRYKPEPV